MDIKFVKGSKFKIISYLEKHRDNKERNVFNDSIKDMDLDNLFGSSRKSSAFKPHEDYLRRVLWQKSNDKFENKKSKEEREMSVIKE